MKTKQLILLFSFAAGILWLASKLDKNPKESKALLRDSEIASGIANAFKLASFI